MLDNKALPYELTGAVNGMKIAQALQKSIVSGQKIGFSGQGHEAQLSFEKDH